MKVARYGDRDIDICQTLQIDMQRGCELRPAALNRLHAVLPASLIDTPQRPLIGACFDLIYVRFVFD